MAGGLGGLGGFDIGNLLGALGSSLLTSPRNNPLQGLPSGIDAANKRMLDEQQRVAMATVAQKLGIDPRIAANPTAMALLIGQQNQQQSLGMAQNAISGVDKLPLFGGGAGGLGGLGGTTAPVAGSSDATPVTPGVLGAAKAAIANNESAGSGGYSAIGPVVNGDRAYGKYQVMGANIPEWTAKHFGRPLSVKEFVNNPDAQEKVFEGQFGGYLQKYGNISDAASMWFSGRPIAQAGNASDGNMTVPQYVAKVNNYLAKNGAAPTQTNQAAPTQVAQADTGTATDAAPQPFQVAAAGAKIPVPLQNVPNVPPPHPNTAGDGTTTQRALAQAQAKYGMKMMIVGGVAKNEGYVKAGQAALDLAKEYLKPTEVERLIEAAKSASDPQTRAILMNSIEDKRPKEIQLAERLAPGDVRQQNQIISRQVPDTRPDLQKLGEATQNSPGTVAAGVQTQAALKGAETAATKTSEITAPAKVALPEALSRVDLALQDITALRDHPGRELATGRSAVIPPLPGTHQYDFITRLGALKGKVFLDAYESLRGAGAITETEGTKGEAAKARLDRAQSEPEFLAALNDLETAMKAGKERLKLKAGVPSIAGGNRTKSGVSWSIEP